MLGSPLIRKSRPTDPKRVQNAGDESTLGIGVGLSIQAVDLGKLVLQRRVLVRNRRIGPQAVAKSQPLVPNQTSEGHEMQTVRALSEAGLAKPGHYICPVWCVLRSQ